jgi:cytochrome c biogenesis protein CcdA
MPGSASASNEGFSAGPYLLDVTDESATVAFHLDQALPAEVLIHDETTIRRFSHAKPSRSHFIAIDGLQPSQTYRYEVTAGSGIVRTPPGDKSYLIKTAGPAGDSFHFVVYGDPRPGETGTRRFHRAVVQEAASSEPFFSILLGDLVDRGNDLQLWQEFFQIEAPLIRKTAVYPVLGDNDRGDLAARFFPKLARGYYRLSWGGVQFMALNAWDSRGRQPRAELDEQSPQIQWLRQQLALPEVRQAPFRIVFMHDPVLISRGKSAEIMRRVWVPIFEEYHVDVVFSSWHLYERLQQNGVVYVVSGGAGAELIWMNANPDNPSLAEAREHHFCRVDVDEDTLSIRAVATDGTVLDEFTLTPRTASHSATGNARNLAERIGQKLVYGPAEAARDLQLYLFSYDCSFCRRLKQRVLPSIAEKYGVRLNVDYFDLGLAESYGLFLNAEAAYGRQGSDLPAIFIGRSVLGGENEIRKKLTTEIELCLENPAAYQTNSIRLFEKSGDATRAKQHAFQALTLPLVAGAGLLDGLNPCAFTTIIFLVSYLHLLGADARRVYWTGGMFTLGVFLTYFFIGLTFYHFLQNYLLNAGISKIVNLLLLLAVSTLAFFSLVDFFRGLKGGVSHTVFKMPQFLRQKLEDKIREHAGLQTTHLAAPFVLGVFISGIELTCTGQVYIPIVTMIADPQYRLTALLYLAVYNLAFILPLVAVFLLTVWGFLHARVGQSKPFVAAVKLGHAAFFSIMAMVILYNIGWI